MRVARPSFSAGVAAPGCSLIKGDALGCYASWERPTCIIADGPYGLGKFPGEPKTPEDLPEWYRPHVAAWATHARPDTTLWFWCTELGWALVHPVLDGQGWQFEECHIWDKGIAQIAGNCNGKTLRGTPVVTEIAVRYTRRNRLPGSDGQLLSLQEWIRQEWRRSGLPMALANEACGVVNAATRKYLTLCGLWYFPPPEAMVRMAEYCRLHGRPTERPYFSLDGTTPLTEQAWRAMRAKWHHSHGMTNVWREPGVRGPERLKTQGRTAHANQKPLVLMRHQILVSTDPGDVVWEPFGGLCSGSAAALETGRRVYAAEWNPDYFELARRRLALIRSPENELRSPP